MNTKTCSIDGCESKYEARGLCSKHYQAARRPAKRAKVCDFCKEEFNPTRRTSTTCRKEECLAARKTRYNKKHNGRRTYELTCTACGIEYTASRKDGKYCPPHKGLGISVGHSPENLKMYLAVREGSSQDVLDAILDRCKVSDEGCWEWQGYRSTSGYGRVSTGRSDTAKQEQTHRVTFEYATGIKPGEMVIHHKCANKACCNPEHLQLATQHENTAEMHARRSFEARIQSLEEALKSVAPDHPLLVG